MKDLNIYKKIKKIKKIEFNKKLIKKITKII